METEIINGHKAIVRHIFPRKELKVGTRWVSADGANLVVTIDEIKIYLEYEDAEKELNSWEMCKEYVRIVKLIATLDEEE
jgi:hypothetical protein